MSTQDVPASQTPDPLALAEAEMADGETLIWADTSSPSGARRRVLPLSLLGWLLMLLLLAWLSKAALWSRSLLVLGLPFLLGAIALASLPWWWPRITRHTIYAISDRRLIIIQHWPKRKVTSYGPDDIDVVERRDYKDGTGDVTFRREEHRKLRHHHDPPSKRRVSDRPIGFFGVTQARRLESAIWALKEKRSLQHEARISPPVRDHPPGTPPYSASSEQDQSGP